MVTLEEDSDREQQSLPLPSLTSQWPPGGPSYSTIENIYIHTSHMTPYIHVVLTGNLKVSLTEGSLLLLWTRPFFTSELHVIVT